MLFFCIFALKGIIVIYILYFTIMEEKIIFKIDTDSPLSVEDFSKALTALNNEYCNFNNGGRELQISEVRKGSYEVEFISTILPVLFTSIEHSNHLIDFISHIKLITNSLLRNKIEKDTTKESIQNINSIVSPVIINNGTLYITSGNQDLPIDNKSAKEIHNNAQRNLSQRDLKNEKTNKTIYKKELFYWQQTNFNKKNPNTGNKGIIEDISKKTIPVIFQDDSSITKTQMTTSKDGIDWQKIGYIVDVEVLRKDGKIKAYKILHNYMEDCIIEEDLFNS